MSMAVAAKLAHSSCVQSIIDMPTYQSTKILLVISFVLEMDVSRLGPLFF